MTSPTIRLMYPKSITTNNLNAATRGMIAFKQFGVQFDTFQITGKEGGAALKGLINGGQIRKMVRSSDSVTIDMFGIGTRIRDVLLGRRIIPIGITNAPLYMTDNDELVPMKTKIAIAARPGHGAIISLPGLQLGAQTPQSMEIAVAQALGIVFGTACKTNDCVMPAKNKSVNTQVENALVTINQIVTSGKEICRDCSAAINKAITRMQSPS